MGSSLMSEVLLFLHDISMVNTGVLTNIKVLFHVDNKKVDWVYNAED